MRMRIIVTALALTACAAALGYQAETPAVKTGAPPPQATVSSRDALIARAKSLELNTPYVPPPGDPLEHRTSGFAKIMCSAVFITGLDPDFAAENVGYFTSPYAERAKVGKPVIDRINKAVHITLPNGVTRTAKYLGDQGCVTLPVGKTSVNFTPVKLKSHLPDASTQPWPMGDVLPKDPLPPELDAVKVKQAVEAAFEPAAGMTAAFVVTWRGRLIALYCARVSFRLSYSARFLPAVRLRNGAPISSLSMAPNRSHSILPSSPVSLTYGWRSPCSRVWRASIR